MDFKKHIPPTMAIRNAGESADMKIISLNKLFGKRKMKCLEIPASAYCQPLANISEPILQLKSPEKFYNI